MAGRKLTVVISQAPGKNPNKRQLEDDIATQLMLGNDADVSVVPHLYDLPADHHAWVWMKGIRGDMVILGWQYPRALRWVLDRQGVRGHAGLTQFPANDNDDEDDEAEPAEAAEAPTGIGSVDVPSRKIYVVDLRDITSPDLVVQEVARIAREAAMPIVSLGGLSGMSTTNGQTPLSRPLSPQEPSSPTQSSSATLAPATLLNLVQAPAVPPMRSPFSNAAAPAPMAETEVRRRWYPVIDYSRCTNCMECLDFCLFGVYGVDSLERILVEEQDNCKRGCPACSRVCPANAIIFPEHKTAAIAGAPIAAAGDFKIDLSKLFGAPSALEMAALERDTELVADGREAVGLTVGVPRRQAAAAPQPRDNLDDLMDQLDNLDL